MGLSAYVVIAGGLFLALWKRPGVALAGVLCMFGLEQWGQATTTFFAQHQTATNYLVGGILIVALSIQGLRKGFSLFAGYPSVGWLTLALFLYAFVSTQWAPRPDISFELWSTRWPYVVTFIVLSPLLITQPHDIRAANTGLLVIGGFLAILLLFFVQWDHRRIVIGSELGNPLTISAMAGMVMLIAVLADPWPESKLWFPIKWAIVGLCLVLIVRSGSRGQLVSAIITSIVCWPISRRVSNLKQFVLLGLMVIFFVVATSWAIREYSSEQMYGAHGSRWSERSAEQDASGRLMNALYLVSLAYDSPETAILGLGNSASYDPRILGIYPHFVPLEVMAEEGIVGFGLYLLIVGCSIKTVFRLMRVVAEEQRERALLGGMTGIYLFTVLLSFKQGSLLLNLESFMLATIIGRYENALENAREIDPSEIISTEKAGSSIFGLRTEQASFSEHKIIS